MKKLLITALLSIVLFSCSDDSSEPQPEAVDPGYENPTTPLDPDYGNTPGVDGDYGNDGSGE
ncbi:hypothetical protein [Flammeovirga kamogawensis]|uniref:Uncharacterized protein n=1 Tax=Flammeovirga kamogawensis TaxID=373891 RepID=A0ABX8H4T4_9BACT|nr:hypothetical protein [Flammeovirga kamogawensis]MBB6461798.1 PBP1b-binding outer membrane lipoprotein LpoB [Flammeovirga kamogawensis]QWG10714.1 hypothetical protein KM029_25355 [Flammeovirga kamogawensis]TRX63816.1 hypothetical protein EO216_25725 [Flammeovirga kamogawensis]